MVLISWLLDYADTGSMWNEPWAAVGKGLWSKLFDAPAVKSPFRWNDKPN